MIVKNSPFEIRVFETKSKESWIGGKSVVYPHYTTATVDVILHLINSKCVPVLL